MIPKGVGSANVTDDGSRIAVPALIHDASEIHASARRFRDVAGPQGMRPEGRGIEPGGLRIDLDDVANRSRRQAGRSFQVGETSPLPSSEEKNQIRMRTGIGTPNSHSRLPVIIIFSFVLGQQLKGQTSCSLKRNAPSSTQLADRS